MKKTDQEKREIKIMREFDAPPKRVFDAFTSRENIGQWWGPEGFSTTTENMQFEVGGEWIFTMHGPDGTDYPNRIVYTEIKKPKYIKYDHFGSEDDDGDPPHFKSTITFEQRGTKTAITLQLLFPTAEARDEAAESGAIEGGGQTLSRLASYLYQHH